MAKNLRSDIAVYLEKEGKKKLLEITNHYSDARMSTTANVVKELFDMVNKGEIVKIGENGTFYYELVKNSARSP